MNLLDTLSGTGSLADHVGDSGVSWINNLNPYGADPIRGNVPDPTSNDDEPPSVFVDMILHGGQEGPSVLNVTFPNMTRAAESSITITEASYDFEFGINLSNPSPEFYQQQVIEFAIGYVIGVTGYTFGINTQDGHINVYLSSTHVDGPNFNTAIGPHEPFALENGIHSFKVSVKPDSTEVFVDGSSVFIGPADPTSAPGIIAFRFSESYVAPEWSSNDSYNVGDYALYNAKIFRFIGSGLNGYPWDTNNWVEDELALPLHQIALDSITLNEVVEQPVQGINTMAGPFLSAIFNGEQFFHDDGTVLSGGLIYTYVAGTTTPKVTYTAADGLIENSNPIVLSADGRPPAEIWLMKGFAYKFRLANEEDVIINDYDNIYGINDMSLTGDASNEWILGSNTPIFVSGDSFAVPGNQLDVYENDRRIRIEHGVGTSFGCVLNQTYDDVNTTITVHLDSGVVDEGISLVHYALLSATHPSVPCQYAKLSGSHFTNAIIDSLTAGTLHVTGTSQFDGTVNIDNTLTVDNLTVQDTANINHLNVTGGITAPGFGDAAAWGAGSNGYVTVGSGYTNVVSVTITVAANTKVCVMFNGINQNVVNDGSWSNFWITRDGNVISGTYQINQKRNSEASSACGFAVTCIDNITAGVHTFIGMSVCSIQSNVHGGILVSKVN